MVLLSAISLLLLLSLMVAVGSGFELFRPKFSILNAQAPAHSTASEGAKMMRMRMRKRVRKGMMKRVRKGIGG